MKNIPIGDKRRKTLSTRKVAAEDASMSKASRQLDYGCRAVKESWDGSTGSEHKWLSLPSLKRIKSLILRNRQKI